jgi:azurin
MLHHALLLLAPLLAGDPVIIEADELLQFRPVEIRLPAGAEVQLVLRNVSRLPNFRHNLVLLHPTADLHDFGNAALNAASEGYIPSSFRHLVLAAIPLTEPGQQKEIQLTVPPPGRYPFLCSFPGRYSVMQGVLISQ